MDEFRQIEVMMAKRYNSTPTNSRKAIGDFFLKDNPQHPVNVKSNNVDKHNYSPNLISARRLVKWLAVPGNELYFLFVDYQVVQGKIKIKKDSGLIKVEHLSWQCLSIEAQGWGVVQIKHPLKINSHQTRKQFLHGLKLAYQVFLKKERSKIKEIERLIKDL
jgi:hypothetical protein